MPEFQKGQSNQDSPPAVPHRGFAIDAHERADREWQADRVRQRMRKRSDYRVSFSGSLPIRGNVGEFQVRGAGTPGYSSRDAHAVRPWPAAMRIIGFAVEPVRPSHPALRNHSD